MTALIVSTLAGIAWGVLVALAHRLAVVTAVDALLAVPSALAVMAGLGLFARHVAGHVHQPSPHYNGRCPICGLDPQETP